MNTKKNPLESLFKTIGQSIAQPTSFDTFLQAVARINTYSGSNSLNFFLA